MSEEQRPTTRQSLISRMFQSPGDDGTTVYSREVVGAGEPGEYEGVGRSVFTVERAAEAIENLPTEVPRSAAVRIVRGTLEAAGIDIADLATSTKARQAKLNSEMDLSRQRIQEIQTRTDEAIRSLEEEIRRARETGDRGVAEEEQRISDAQMDLEDVRMVRDFFDMPLDDAGLAGGGEPADAPRGYAPAVDDTQVIERVNEDDTQVIRGPGPLSGDWQSEEDTWESPNR